MATEDTLSTFQTQLLYIALACFAANFLLDTQAAKGMFGIAWLVVKNSNAVIMWLAAILSGKKFLDLLDRFKKVAEDKTIKNE